MNLSGLHNLLTLCGTLEEQWLDGGGVVVVEENLEMIYEGVNVDVKGFDGFLVVIQRSKRRMKGEIFPQDIDDGVRVCSGRGNMHNRRGKLMERGSHEDNSKERVTMSFAE